MKFKWKVLICCAALLCTSALVGNLVAGTPAPDQAVKAPVDQGPATLTTRAVVDGPVNIAPRDVAATSVAPAGNAAVAPIVHQGGDSFSGSNLPPTKGVMGNTGNFAQPSASADQVTRGGGGLLCAWTEADNPTFRGAVSAILGMPVDYIDARTNTPSVATMQGYLAVITWVNYAYQDAIGMGNNLADYVDAGGKAILGQWCYDTGQFNSLDGRIMDLGQPYLPCTCASRTSGTYGGGGATCIHLGIATADAYATDYRDNCTTFGSGLSDGVYTDGQGAQFYQPTQQVYYSPGQTGLIYSTGDWAELAANMVMCAGGPIFGACCQEDTGVCEDGIEPGDCFGSGPYARWIFEGQCEELEPGCGEIMGACCLETECQYVKPSVCDSLGGDYVGDFVPCDPNPCLCADVFLDAPVFDYAGNTCGAVDDCPIRTFEDVQFQVTLPIDATWVFSLCGSSYDTWHYLGHDCCTSDVFSQDDSSQCGLQGYIEVALTAGTYHYTVDAYSGCGAFTLDIYPLVGACCLPDGTCQIMGQSGCTGAGGVYGGHGSECAVDDCDGDGQSDYCELALGVEEDCNDNGIPDSCDIADGTSPDVDGNGVPDECQEDCNENGILDGCDISCDGVCADYYPPPLCGQSSDCQPDGIPDECQLGGGGGGGTGPILYAPSQPDEAAWRALVSGVTGEAVDYFDARSATPTLAQLENYAAVFTWANYAYADREAYGNVLADYVDGGGTVILGQWCLCTAGNCLGGRIMNPAEGYLPVTGASWTGPKSYAGDGSGCFTEGVTAYTTNWCDNATLLAGAEADGHYADGTPLTANFPGVSVVYMPGVLQLAGGTVGDNHILVANGMACMGGGGSDCDANGIPDDCDIADCGTEASYYYPSTWQCLDCQENGLPDICDIAEVGDCNGNMIPDDCDIDGGFSQDCQPDGIPDECQLADNDCQPDGIPDDCQLEDNDCNDNGIPDTCEGFSDCNGDGIADICDSDCDEDGQSDICQIYFCDGSPYCQDCNGDGIPDGWQVMGGRGTPYVLLYSEFEYSTTIYESALNNLGWAFFKQIDPFTLDSVINQGGWTHIVINHENTGSDYPWQDALVAYMTANPDTGLIVSDWRNPARAYLTALGFGFGSPNFSALSAVDGGVFDGLADATIVNPGYGIYSNRTTGGIVEATTGADGAINHIDGTCWFAFGPGGDCWGDPVLGALYAAAALESCTGGCTTSEDCNGNGIPDECDIASGTSNDCNENDIPDECEPDCNDNGIADQCDIDSGFSQDCNGDGIPDECQLVDNDCNEDGIPDDCQLEDNDCNDNGIPDDCEPLDDCNDDGTPDICDADCDGSGTSDACDIFFCAPDDPYCQDCNGDGVPDGWQVMGGRGAGSILYAPSQPDEAAWRALVAGVTGGPVDYFDARTATPTVDQLLAYQAVFTWANYAYADSTAYGNNLADYVDAGGTVVLGQWCLCTAGNCLGGRIMNPAEGYLPVTASAWTGGTSSYAGDGTGCWTTGVTAYSTNWRDDATLLPGALFDGTYSGSGTVLTAYFDGVGVVYMPGVLQIAGGTTGDNHILIANALGCFGPGCPTSEDCNGNGVPDECDIASGTSNDCNENDIPDECEPDCNDNGIADECDIDFGTSQDCNEDGIPDECQLVDNDCNENGIPDECEPDCNANGIPDDCDLADCDGSAWCSDCNDNGYIDECDLDCVPGRGTRDLLYSQAGIVDDTGVGSTGLLATGSDIGQNWTAIDNFVIESEGQIVVNQFYWEALYFGGSTDCGDGHYIELRLYGSEGGGSGSGDCCFAHPGTGCEDPACEASVCSYDSYCCVTSWDSICSGEAATDPACSCGGGGFTLLQTWPSVQYARGDAPRPPVFGTYPVYTFMSDPLFPPMNLESGVEYWLSVLGDPDSIGCPGNFGWLASAEAPPGDLLYYQDTGGGFVSTDADLAFGVFGTTGPPACDCNENGVPDECDIASGFSRDCDLDGIPDECDEAVLCGDLDGDGDVDFDDREILRAALGSTMDDDNWLLCADFDGDGMVTLVDYQMWRECYLAFGGKLRGGAPDSASSR